MFVGIYKGIMIPGFLRWCRISSIHSRVAQVEPLVPIVAYSFEPQPVYNLIVAQRHLPASTCASGRVHINSKVVHSTSTGMFVPDVSSFCWLDWRSLPENT